jgi:osmotically-inducible protein OsmY
LNRAALVWAGALAFALAILSGCVPVLVAGAVGGTAMVATDRRSAGVQVDDEAIELKLSSRIGTDYETRVHVNVTSFNGAVLITGEVPDQEALTYIGNLAKGTEKVRTVHNELVVGPNSDLSSRSNDTYITGKVKSRMIEANKFPPNAVKVVTERGVVYLMGLVSKEEGDAAAEIAATTSGVVRVVKFFQYPT